MARHAVAGAVIAEPEGAVFANHCIDRPHACDMVAPASRPASDRYRMAAGGLPALQRGKAAGANLPLVGEGVVDVKEHPADRR